MIIFIDVDTSNRVVGWGSTPSVNNVQIEVVEDHEVIKNPFIFRYENGQLIRDDEYQQQRIAEKEAAANLPTTEQRMELFEMFHADLLMESVQDKIKISDLEQTNADLMLTLAMKGVI